MATRRTKPRAASPALDVLVLPVTTISIQGVVDLDEMKRVGSTDDVARGNSTARDARRGAFGTPAQRHDPCAGRRTFARRDHR
jgi:hypothetical protein